MNKRQKPVSAKTKKKNDKEVHKGMNTPSTPIRAIITKAKSVLATKKTQKLIKKHSKRTAPYEQITGSTPAHLHTENERWTNTLQKQSKLKAVSIQRKLTHNKAKRTSSR